MSTASNPDGRRDLPQTSIFTEMTELALRTGSVNLGQGVPDLPSPPELLAHAAEAVLAGQNQYPPAAGLPALRTAVTGYLARRTGVDHHPEHGVLVTTGATEAMAAALIALCRPGDEVLTFDPCYDAYPAVVRLAGARLIGVPLAVESEGFALDPAALHAAVTPRSRVLLLNTPHNPTGKVFTAAELAEIADLCRRHDLTVITDEVYENLVYDGLDHLPIAALPGMRERTLTVSSAGKSFNVTGWKIGWACGPAELVAAVASVKQFLTYATGTPFQAALAAFLAEDAVVDGYTDGLRRLLGRHRDLLTAGLRAAGLRPYRGEGGYFVQADVRPWGYRDGETFCRELPKLAGVVAIPTSAFRQHPSESDWLVRFAFCKSEATVREAADRLLRARHKVTICYPLSVI